MSTGNLCCEGLPGSFDFASAGPGLGLERWRVHFVAFCARVAAGWRALRVERELDRMLAGFDDRALREIGLASTPHRRALRPFHVE